MYNKNTSRQLNAVKSVSRAVNKKGRLKGKNKKETRMLKYACPHHIYTKKGKLKPTFFNTNNGECICDICGRSFQTKIENKGAVKDITAPLLSLANQGTVAAVAGGLGAKAVDQFVNFKVMLEQFPKNYSRTMKVVSKADNLGKKNKSHNRRNGGGSSQYGSWKRS